MLDEQTATGAASQTAPEPLPSAPPPPPPSPAAIIQAALDHLAHPTTLDLHARLHALEQAVRVMAQALMPLLPTE